MSPDLPSVLIRITTSPVTERDELLAVYVDSRTTSDPSVVVYSVTRDEWRVEHHRRLMWRTRRVTPDERARAVEALALVGERVRVLMAAPNVWAAPQYDKDTDEAPVEGKTPRT
jgi:hypothetical protein